MYNGPMFLFYTFSYGLIIKFNSAKIEKFDDRLVIYHYYKNKNAKHKNIMLCVFI